jgi:hypothetical protein
MPSPERSTAFVAAMGFFAFAQFAPAYGQQTKAARPVVCPASIRVNESAEAVPGWTTSGSTTQHRFERISVYNGNAGGQEFELAPDDQKQQGSRITQSWMLKGYRTMNIFLRCRYHDSSVVLLRDLPPEIGSCTLRFTIGGKGEIVGESAMECR